MRGGSDLHSWEYVPGDTAACIAAAVVQAVVGAQLPAEPFGRERARIWRANTRSSCMLWRATARRRDRGRPIEDAWIAVRLLSLSAAARTVTAAKTQATGRSGIA